MISNCLSRFNGMHKTTLVLILLTLIDFGSLYGQSVEIQGISGSGKFGTHVSVLTNGNFVVTDPEYDEAGVTDIGAVYLYDGESHTLIATLKGTTPGDRVGLGGITSLPNG